MQSNSFFLNTDAIRNGSIERRYTCDLDNSSPELHWENVPAKVLGFALVVEDLDAPQGIFTHWVIYNIPAEIHHLPAGIPPQEALPNGIRQGVNSLGKLGYTGPCPPSGDSPHRYRFRIFALNHRPTLQSRISQEQLFQVIGNHIIGVAETIGKYQRAIQRAG